MFKHVSRQLLHLSPSLLFPVCCVPTKLSPPVFHTLNTLSITNCVAPLRPSHSTLFPLSGIDCSVFKHWLKNTACHSSEKDQSVGKKRGPRRRKTLRMGEGPLDKSPCSLINLPVPCVRWSLIKALVDYTCGRQVLSLPVCLSLG